MMDDVYGSKGTAKIIVKENLRGLFSLAEPKEAINESAVDMTAGMFVAKYGAELSVFGMLYYFANYLTEYKSSYGRFDMQDVLRQCQKQYIPWWRNRLGRLEDANRQSGATEQTGKAALWAYLRREYVGKGRDVRESALYQYGRITEKECQMIESGEEIAL